MPAATVPVFDLLVVGGGVNGAGIARDAAGRGWSVALCERDDLASHTSSASTKLIHGGLRYLEHHEFSLVRKALIEREVLLANAPHIMRPLRFILPHEPSMRPAWMMRLGLFLYDNLAHRDLLPGSATVDLRTHVAGGKLLPQYRQGFAYSDGWVDDARLVVLNAVGAAAEGARVMTRTACIDCRADGDLWRVRLQRLPARADEPCEAGPFEVRARAVVNATGQWVDAGPFAAGPTGQGDRREGRPGRTRRVQGSHIVVPRLFDHGFAYILQNDDRRIVFAIPYERDFTLIGTTDVELDGPPAPARITAAEIDYLCAAVNRYFTRRISPADVVWSYAGVRPLMDDANGDPAAVTRDYLLELPPRGLPLLTVRGGKITTYRKLAEEAVDRLATRLPGVASRRSSGWTARAPLPGGDVASVAAYDDRCQRWVRDRWPWLPEALLQRWARAYGTRTADLIGAAGSLSELGAEIAPGLPEAELRYWRDQEWARTADDALWRRSKLGLRLDREAQGRVADWFADQETGRDRSEPARPEAL